MPFEWDDEKNARNYAKHRISFGEAVAIFDGPVYTVVDDRFDYGEVRHISIGSLSGVLIVVVVHTQRGERMRIVSARRASRKEREVYHEYLERTAGGTEGAD